MGQLTATKVGGRKNSVTAAMTRMVAESLAAAIATSLIARLSFRLNSAIRLDFLGNFKIDGAVFLGGQAVNLFR